jgi:hypothetical protein
LRPLVPLGSSLKGTIGIIAAMIVVGVVLVVVLENFGPLAAAMRDPAHQSINAPRAANKPLVELAPPNRPAAQKRPLPPPAEAQTKDESTDQPVAPETPVEKPEPAPIDLKNETVRRVMRAAQPEFLLRPEVAERLGLGDEQIARLQQLLQELREALSALGTDALAESDEELVKFGARAWEVLTDQQRQLFAALYVPPRPGPGGPAIPPAAQPTPKPSA